ncbi:MAG TPA: CCA tRNA nucleotidyltransferase [Candidatus Sulfotelmatobacter sp.]|nr:CCA tRNA nucleotidyltransferase [Candidatus Sulfotelmatobacter sp.]
MADLLKQVAESGFSAEFSTAIVQTLRQRGFQAYLVGGCVRDLLLGREPKDYDVATNATPEQVMAIFPETYAVGAQFGVVLVPVPERDVASDASTERSNGGDLNCSCSTHAHAVEVASFRSDIGYSDGRHPDEVRFSQDPREDVGRRDFTINGMLLDPVSGEVLDFVGGRKDLEGRIIRAIGEPERRFAEDKLRMLRAVRFAARFEYAIEPGTLAAIRKLAGEIHVVSRERVRDELTRMLTEGHASRAFLLLDETGLLREVLPEISAMKGVQQPPQFHPEGDVFVHTLLLLENLPQPCPPALAWGALLHDVGKPATFRVAPDRIRFDGHAEVGVKMAEEICRRLRFSGDDTEQVLALVDNHMRFGHATRMSQSTLKKFLRMPRFDQHLALHRADSLASHGNLSTYEFVKEKLAAIPPEKRRPSPLVSGDDLIAAGYAPGPKFREILGAVEDAQLEGRLASRDSALEFVRREFPA